MTESKTTAPRRAANGEVPGSLAEALAAFQAKLPKIAKGETGEVKGVSKDNGRPFSYTYKYADLAAVSAAVMPLLGSLGLSFTAKPTLLDGQFVLAYTLRHASGEADEGIYPLPDRGSSQQIGSAITYARRYALLAVTGVAPDSDDDDGAAASQETHRMSRSAGDAWESARPAPQRGQRPNGQPQSARDAWESATPAEGNGQQGQTQAGDVPDDVLGAWAAKLDEIASIEDGIEVSSELERQHKGGVIDSGRYKVIRGAIKAKVDRLPGAQARPHRPTGPSAEERGAKPVPTGKGDDGEWVQGFMRRLSEAGEDDLGGLQAQIGNAVRAKTISPAKSADLSKAIRERRAELQKVPA